MKNVDKELDNMIKECKRNKISESLLLLNKALYLQSVKTAEAKTEQKSLVEVIFSFICFNRQFLMTFIILFNREHIKN